MRWYHSSMTDYLRAAADARAKRLKLEDELAQPDVASDQKKFRDLSRAYDQARRLSDVAERYEADFKLLGYSLDFADRRKPPAAAAAFA